MKIIFSITLLLLLNISAFSQIKPSDKVFFEFEETSGEVNVNGENAIESLNSYIIGKTNLIVADAKAEAKYLFTLSVVEKNMGKRKGRIVITEIENNKLIFDTEWQKANSSAFYGYSGTRAVIGKMIKQILLKEYKELSVD